MNPLGQRRVIELAEWTKVDLHGEVLTPADQRLVTALGSSDARITVQELRDGVRIIAHSGVGIVRFERLEVRIVPKIAGGNLRLVEMIELTTGLEALRSTSSARGLSTGGVGLFDLIALLLAEGVESILRAGLLAGYVEREEDLPVVRGRLLGDQQVLRRFGQVERLACRFDELEQDVIENQLLAAALRLCAPRVTHEAVRRRVRRLLAVLLEACDPDSLDLAGARAQMSYHRLNEHYRGPHGLAWLILDGLGTRDVLASGSTECFAFLIDMNQLFESFVHRAIEVSLAGSSLKVHYQRADPTVIVDVTTGRSYSRVVPDILIEGCTANSTARVAVDAKYKLYDERKISPADVYQSFLYAFAYGGDGDTGLPASMLVYPSSEGATGAVNLRIRNARRVTSADVFAIALPVPDTIDELRGRAPRRVTRVLADAVYQAMGVSQRVA